MKKSVFTSLLIILFYASSGCAKRDATDSSVAKAAKKDAIDSFIAENTSNPTFGNGFYKPINLPTNAPIDEVVTQALKYAQPFPIPVNNMDIITQRQVEIASETYIAVLISTPHEQKIVLLQCLGKSSWNDTFDVK